MYQWTGLSCTNELGYHVPVNWVIMYQWTGLSCTSKLGYHVPVNWVIMYQWTGLSCTSELGYHVPVNWVIMYQWTGLSCTSKLGHQWFRLRFVTDLFGTKPLPEPTVTWCQLDPRTTSVKSESKYNTCTVSLIQENAFENGVHKMAAIFLRPQSVNSTHHLLLKHEPPLGVDLAIEVATLTVVHDNV